jgi:hypothetical protein
MKLYNLYKEVIFEEIEKSRRLLNEGASDEEIISAINGVKGKNGKTIRYNYNIQYRDKPNTPPSIRYVQIYVYGQLENGNYAIRAYQISGGSASKKPSEWKLFRVDKIVSMTKTKMMWDKPISSYSTNTDEFGSETNMNVEKPHGYIGKYNQNGDNKGNFNGGVGPTFKKIIAQVKF